jgi:hypothetical protein
MARNANVSKNFRIFATKKQTLNKNKNIYAEETILSGCPNVDNDLVSSGTGDYFQHDR